MAIRVIKAKILATGEQIIAYEKEGENGVFFCPGQGADFKSEELTDIQYLREVSLEEFPLLLPPKDSTFTTTSILEKLLERHTNNFWRDQRVEIVKILLRSANPFGDLEPLVAKADAIIQKLKSCKD